MTGRIFQVQRFCTHDGPGIRTTIFLKGCPLRCRWCHNPEGLAYEIERMRDARKCIGCGLCAGTDAGKCPTGALRLAGEDIDAQTLCALALRDRVFYGLQGGVTFSGGEPMAQADFVCDVMARLAQEGVGCVIETAGFAPFSAYEKTLRYCNHYLYDVKFADSALHRAWTGRDNDLILDNLRALAARGARLWVRVPVIGGANDTAQEMRAIGRILRALPATPERVELMPYHDLGRAKCDRLGIPYPMERDAAISDERLAALREALETP